MYGALATEDHHCIVIDNTVAFFSASGDSFYVIPDGIKSIGDAFANTTLDSLVIANSVTSIDGQIGGPNLKCIVLPDNLQSIYYGWWYGLNCYDDIRIYCRNSTPPIPTTKYYNSPNREPQADYLNALSSLRARDAWGHSIYWYVPESAIDSYKETWGLEMWIDSKPNINIIGFDF